MVAVILINSKKTDHWEVINVKAMYKKNIDCLHLPNQVKIQNPHFLKKTDFSWPAHVIEFKKYIFKTKIEEPLENDFDCDLKWTDPGKEIIY